MENLKILIKKYVDGKLTLFDFENEVLKFPIKPMTDEFLTVLLEDIGYTSKGFITEADKQSGIISEKELKQRLRDYLNGGIYL